VPDFRDSWTASTLDYVPVRPSLLAELERRLEARLLRDAAAVVTVDARMVAHAFERIAPEDRPPCHVIPNGYDEDDFAATLPASLPPFSIVHTGQLRRSPGAIWEALAAAIDTLGPAAPELHFWQIGFVDPRATADLSSPPRGVTVHHVPPVPQQEAIGYMLGADMLLVEEFDSVMPSKTLQYLRAARPLLALTERGGVIVDVLEGVPDTHLAPRARAVEAGPWVARMAARGRIAQRQPPASVTAFSRREIARRFAAVLDATQAVPP
jgi:hypothetical protein